MSDAIARPRRWFAAVSPAGDAAGIVRTVRKARVLAAITRGARFNARNHGADVTPTWRHARDAGWRIVEVFVIHPMALPARARHVR